MKYFPYLTSKSSLPFLFQLFLIIAFKRIQIKMAKSSFDEKINRKHTLAERFWFFHLQFKYSIFERKMKKNENVWKIFPPVLCKFIQILCVGTNGKKAFVMFKYISFSVLPLQWGRMGRKKCLCRQEHMNESRGAVLFL